MTVNNEQQSNAPTNEENQRVADIINSTPAEQFEVATDQKVLEITLNDDPTISIESLSDEEKECIKLHFIGSSHGSEFDQAVLTQLVDFKPNVIIYETSSASLKHRKTLELIRASSMISAPFELTIPGKLTPTWIKSEVLTDTTQDQISRVIKLLRTTEMRPLLRAMDLPRDELSKVSGLEYPGTKTWAARTTAVLTEEGIDANSIDINGITDETLLKKVDEALHEDANVIQLRDDAMIADISRITGNIRRKMSATQLRVAVLSGAAHADYLEDMIAKMGITTTHSYAFGDIRTSHPTDLRLMRMLFDMRKKQAA